MRQEKMGYLLRELRKEKGITQEQMAELFGVTNRTVSRWENGINLPDISVLVEISEFFEVDILDLIKGERRQEIMVTESNEDLKEIGNYADEQKNAIVKKVHNTDLVGLIFCLMSGVAMGVYRTFNNNIILLLQVGFLGIASAMLVANILYTTGIDDMFKRYKNKHHLVKYLEILLLIILLLKLCWDGYLIVRSVF